MMILAIDTTSSIGSLAVLSNDQVIGEVSSKGITPYSERLFSDLAVLQTSASFKMSDIDVFAVSAGPGSFTGLRVGLAAVKAWAEVHGKPIAAISGLEAIASQSRAGVGLIASFVDAHRGQVFGATFRRREGASARLDASQDVRSGSRLERLGDEAVLSELEFLGMVQANFGTEPGILVSPTPDVLSAAAVELRLSGTRIEQVSENLAPAIGRLGYQRALRGELTDALHLEANYIQRAKAEILQKVT